AHEKHQAATCSRGDLHHSLDGRSVGCDPRVHRERDTCDDIRDHQKREDGYSKGDGVEAQRDRAEKKADEGVVDVLQCKLEERTSKSSATVAPQSQCHIRVPAWDQSASGAEEPDEQLESAAEHVADDQGPDPAAV